MAHKKKKRTKKKHAVYSGNSKMSANAHNAQSTLSAAGDDIVKEKKHPILRYGLTVLLFMSCFYGLYWSESLVEKRWFRPFTDFQAEVAQWLLIALQQDVSRSGNVLVSESVEMRPYTLAVGLGCEAFDVTILAMVGILCFPALWKQRILGALLAGTFIQCMNMLRLTTLFIVGLHKPEYFEFVHYNLWQIILIICVIGVWWIWLIRIRSRFVTDENSNDHLLKA